MADEYKHDESASHEVETRDRGLFDFGKKKDEEELIAAELDEKVQVNEGEENKQSLLEKLKRSDSSNSSSSSSDEEEVVGEDEEKKKKKKGLKEKLKEKLGKGDEDTAIPVERVEEAAPAVAVAAEPEEKKGLLEKIKEKLPGGQSKKTEEDEVAAPPPHPAVVETLVVEEEKGLLEKIKDKIPGFHSRAEEEGKN